MIIWKCSIQDVPLVEANYILEFIFLIYTVQYKCHGMLSNAAWMILSLSYVLTNMPKLLWNNALNHSGLKLQKFQTKMLKKVGLSYFFLMYFTYSWFFLAPKSHFMKFHL